MTAGRAPSLALLTDTARGVPLFLTPFGVAVLILAGLSEVALGALCCLVVLLPIVRYLAADR